MNSPHPATVTCFAPGADSLRTAGSFVRPAVWILAASVASACLVGFGFEALAESVAGTLRGISELPRVALR